jgi:hypothetical protein
MIKNSTSRETVDRDTSAKWIKRLKEVAEDRPIVLLRLNDGELESLRNTRNGITDFTLTLRHDAVKGIAKQSVCIILGEMEVGPAPNTRTRPVAYISILSSHVAVATLDSRLKFKRSGRIHACTETELISALPQVQQQTELARRFRTTDDLFVLGPKLSVAIMEALSQRHENRAAMKMVAAGLYAPESGSPQALQFDAVQSALKAFGLAADTPASTLELASRSTSSLENIRVLEDAVIEHDARFVQGYDLVNSHITGRATFRKGMQTLEVYTANRNKLEETFGVDLIYLNLFHRNIVMVQYKMLSQHAKEPDGGTDWVYTEDRHLPKQLAAMRRFATRRMSDGYRLNAETFYFKFVRRLSSPPNTNVLLPLGHFERMLLDPAYRRKTGKIKFTYNALDGRYMRQTAFFDLLQAGYIGADAETACDLATLINSVVRGDDAVVIAVQRQTHGLEEKEDRSRIEREFDWHERDA